MEKSILLFRFWCVVCTYMYMCCFCLYCIVKNIASCCCCFLFCFFIKHFSLLLLLEVSRYSSILSCFKHFLVCEQRKKCNKIEQSLYNKCIDQKKNVREGFILFNVSLSLSLSVSLFLLIYILSVKWHVV